MSEQVEQGRGGGSAMGTGILVASLALVTVVVAGGYLGLRHRTGAGAADASAGATTQPTGAARVESTSPVSKTNSPPAPVSEDVERLAAAIGTQQTLRA